MFNPAINNHSSSLQFQRPQQTLSQRRLIDSLPNQDELRLLVARCLRCCGFVRVVDVAYALDQEHAAVGDGDACFEAVDFERLGGWGVREGFFPEDGAEEEVEFGDLRWG